MLVVIKLKSSNLQAPNAAAVARRLPCVDRRRLGIGFWDFFGVWGLEFGAFHRVCTDFFQSTVFNSECTRTIHLDFQRLIVRRAEEIHAWHRAAVAI